MPDRGCVMASPEERNLIAPCGIYCGGCPLYQARTDAVLRRRIAEKSGVPEDKLALCEGCRPLKGREPAIGGEICSTYACATNDKKVEFCYQCSDFPCLKLAPCADRAQELSHNTKIYNLLLIKRDGVDSFIRNYRGRIGQYFRGKKPKPGGEIQ